MDAGASAVLGWLVPSAVAVGVVVLALAVTGWMLRRARRSPRAVHAADRARTAAGAALVHLDDAVGELDLQIGLSGALYGGDAPASLRRARLTAQHVRDDAFMQFRDVTDDTSLLPADVQRRAERIAAHANQALQLIAHAGAENDQWVHDNAAAGREIASARERLDRVRAQTGDPSTLIAQLAARFDASEWSDAAAAADTATAAAAEAEMLLERAAQAATDPSRSALSDLTLAERRIQRAQERAQYVERAYASLMEAADALTDELDGAHDALRQADGIRDALADVDPDAAVRLGGELQAARAATDAAARDAPRFPARATAAIAGMRDRLDLALGDARTATQRMHGARTALPGTIAVAERAVTRAAESVTGAGADARVRLSAAQDELAKTRQLADPVEALDAARRAIRDAEDAEALAAYDRRA